MSQDFNAIPVYICFLGTAGVKDQYFTVIQILVLAVSQQSALEGTTEERFAVSTLASINVSATFDNGLISYVPGLNNQIDVASIPKLGFNLSFAIKIMNVPNPQTPGVAGPDSLSQPLQFPPLPEECRGSDIIYLIGDLDAARGTIFVLVWTWQVALFCISFFILCWLLRYNDFNRTLLRILAQNFRSDYIESSNPKAPRLFFLKKGAEAVPFDSVKEESDYITVMSPSTETLYPVSTRKQQLTVDSAIQTSSEATSNSILHTLAYPSFLEFQQRKGKYQGIVVTLDDSSRPAQVISFAQLRELLYLYPNRQEELLDLEETCPAIPNPTTFAKKERGQFRDLLDFWEGYPADEVINMYL